MVQKDFGKRQTRLHIYWINFEPLFHLQNGESNVYYARKVKVVYEKVCVSNMVGSQTW